MTFEIALAKRYGAFSLDLAFKSESGITALFGPSGAGKTSVLDMVAGIRKPDRGRIVVDGVVLFDKATAIDLPPEHRRAGYIFQDGRLFPHMSVERNLLYGFRLTPPEHRFMSLEEAVGFLGIGHLLERRPSTLSGGEAQRVAIGRALLAGPRFLLMDEPLSALDRNRKDEILIIIERLRDQLKLPILYVTHDADELKRLNAQVIALNS